MTYLSVSFLIVSFFLTFTCILFLVGMCSILYKRIKAIEKYIYR